MIPYTNHRIVHFIIDFPPYLMLYWIGWLVGLYVIIKESDRLNLNRKNVIIIYLTTLLVGPIVGRLFFFLGPWNSQHVPFMQFFNFGFDAYVFYGTFVGGFLGLVISTRILKEKIWRILDVFTMGLAIGMFFGRIGCFFAGCCYGKKTTSVIGFDIINRDYARFPTQTISSLYNLLIFLILQVWKYKKRFDGQIALLFFMLYSIARFLIEFLRVYTWHYLGLSMSQYLSIILFVTSIGLYIYKNDSLRNS